METAKGLQLGNLVTHVNEPETIQTIIQLERDFEQIGTDYTHADMVACELFNPIPLTPEWLVRLGFHASHNKDGNKTFHILDNHGFTAKHTITLYDEGYKWEGMRYVKFVHAVQNIFFAWEEKELELKELA